MRCISRCHSALKFLLVVHPSVLLHLWYRVLCLQRGWPNVAQSSGGASGKEGSGAENCYGGAVLETPIDQVGLLLDNLTKRHEGFTRPQSNFIGSEDSGARFRELAHLFAERDAFASELLSVMKMMASQMKEWQARGGEGDGEEDVQAFSNVRTGTLSRKKMKVERTPFEQKVNNLVKVRTGTCN